LLLLLYSMSRVYHVHLSNNPALPDAPYIPMVQTRGFTARFGKLM
jgi:hypothetical protein